MNDDTIKVLRKYGICKMPFHGKKDPGEYITVCQGCGKRITNTDPDLDTVVYVITKRGDAMFFHRDHVAQARDSKIRWLNPGEV